jgi:hypothetical protein
LRIADIYRLNQFLMLSEWHSAYVWDVGRDLFDLKERNLTPGGRGHVWMRSPLASWSMHNKGVRKGRER